MAGSQRSTDHVLHAIKTVDACDRCYHQHTVIRGWLHRFSRARRAAQAVNITNYLWQWQPVSGVVWYCCCRGFAWRVHASTSFPRVLYISDLSQSSLQQLAPSDHLTLNRWNANNGALYSIQRSELIDHVSSRKKTTSAYSGQTNSGPCTTVHSVYP
jgi:hypothetical protein